MLPYEESPVISRQGPPTREVMIMRSPLLISHFAILAGIYCFSATIEAKTIKGKAWPALRKYENSGKKRKGSSSHNLPAGQPWAISRFLFRFENGDHELRRLRLQPNDTGRTLNFAFHDYNSDDPYSVSYGLIGLTERAYAAGGIWNQISLRKNVNAGPSKAEQKKLGGACMNGAGYVPLLTGFDFNHSGKDVGVRRLAAICAVETIKQCKTVYGWKTARVENQGKCKPGQASRYAKQVVYRQAWEESGRLDTDDIEAFFDSKRSYGDKSVRAKWLYVPITAIDQCRTFYGRDTHAIADFARGRDVAIQGFDYRFLDTDHHILEVGLQPQSGDGNNIRFRDNDGNDPFEYRVQICSLKKNGNAPTPTLNIPIQPTIPPAAMPLLIPKLPGGGSSGPKVPNYTSLSFVTSHAGTSGKGEKTASANIRGVPLLSSFFFGFTNGDHKIRAIGVEPIGGSVHFTYSDGNGDDPFKARAIYIGADGVALKTIQIASKDEYGAPAYNCNVDTKCRWTIGQAEGVPTRFVAVLSGFHFERKATDANIGALGAGQLGTTFQALLSEEGGWDWRHVNSQTDRGARAPKFRGSVALVPKSRIESCSQAIGQWHGKKSRAPKKRYDSVQLEPGKRFVLQSVGFSFGVKKDHYLEKLGVEYNSSTGELRVHFKDKNRDDPYSWSVSYCYLK